MVVHVSTAPDWTFPSNDGHVLLVVVADLTAMRDLADRIGIIERALQLILTTW